MEGRHSHSLLVEIKIGTTFMEGNLSISVRNTNALPLDLVIAFLGNTPHIYLHMQREVCIRLLISVL